MFGKLVRNEAKWIGKKTKESAEQIKQSDAFEKLKDTSERILHSDTINKIKEARIAKQINKRWWIIGGFAAILCLAVFLFSGRDNHSYDNAGSSSLKSSEYSWLYGTWVANLDGIRDVITITEYSITNANIYLYDTGSYRIEGASLFAKYSQMPKGIVTTYDLDPLYHRISSGGHFYTKE